MGIKPHFLFDFIQNFSYICPINTIYYMKAKNTTWVIAKLIVGRLILTILTLAAIVFFIRWTSNKYDSTKAELVQEMGTTIVIGNDTLIVVDYSTLEGSFTLSNGTSVSKDYVSKYKIK